MLKSEKNKNMFEDLSTMGKYIRIHLSTPSLVSGLYLPRSIKSYYEIRQYDPVGLVF